MLCFPRLGDYGYLGNAMFQYAALLGIANKTGFNPVYDFDKEGTMCTLHKSFPLTKVTDMPHHEQVHTITRIWKEPHFHFCEEAFSVKEGTGLNGYFQSEKYFKHIEDVIKSEFQHSKKIKEDCKKKIKDAKEQTKSESLISVHIRLGDYQKLEHVYVPLLKTDYYTKAIGFMKDNIKESKAFVIFSDNIEICQQILKGPEFVFASGGNAEQDMCLMSLCEHNIIANSSFGWWPAWLNDNKDKTVIAPINWFTPDPKNEKDTKDLYCDGWLKI